jgi:hypothetical protein
MIILLFSIIIAVHGTLVLGSMDKACDARSFPRDLSDKTCSGLHKGKTAMGSDPKSAAECINACCAEGVSHTICSIGTY